MVTATYVIRHYFYTGAAFRTGGADNIPTELTLTNCTEAQLIYYVCEELMYGFDEDNEIVDMDGLNNYIDNLNGDGCSLIVNIKKQRNLIYNNRAGITTRMFNKEDVDRKTIDMRKEK